jgi:hypothetical protein
VSVAGEMLNSHVVLRPPVQFFCPVFSPKTANPFKSFSRADAHASSQNSISHNRSSVITIATDFDPGRYRRVLDINGRVLRPFCKGMIGGTDIALIAAPKEERTNLR